MTDTVVIRLDDLANLLTVTSVGDWDPAKHPELAESWHRVAAIKDAAMAGQPVPQPEPGLPPGEFATVHIMGHDQVTGWVTDGTRAGVPVMIVRDWDGRVVREIPGHALYQFVPLPTPLRAPEPLAELPAGHYEGDYSHEGGPHGCDCGPGERCFECATDEEAAAAIPPPPAF